MSLLKELTFFTLSNRQNILGEINSKSISRLFDEVISSSTTSSLVF